MLSWSYFVVVFIFLLFASVHAARQPVSVTIHQLTTNGNAQRINTTSRQDPPLYRVVDQTTDALNDVVSTCPHGQYTYAVTGDCFPCSPCCLTQDGQREQVSECVRQGLGHDSCAKDANFPCLVGSTTTWPHHTQTHTQTHTVEPVQPITDHCLKGFYRSRVTEDCVPCVKCCNTSMGPRIEVEACKKQGLKDACVLDADYPCARRPEPTPTPTPEPPKPHGANMSTFPSWAYVIGAFLVVSVPVAVLSFVNYRRRTRNVSDEARLIVKSEEGGSDNDGVDDGVRNDPRVREPSYDNPFEEPTNSDVIHSELKVVNETSGNIRDRKQGTVPFTGGNSNDSSTSSMMEADSATSGVNPFYDVNASNLNDSSTSDSVSSGVNAVNSFGQSSSEFASDRTILGTTDGGNLITHPAADPIASLTPIQETEKENMTSLTTAAGGCEAAPREVAVCDVTVSDVTGTIRSSVSDETDPKVVVGPMEVIGLGGNREVGSMMRLSVKNGSNQDVQPASTEGSVHGPSALDGGLAETPRLDSLKVNELNEDADDCCPDSQHQPETASSSFDGGLALNETLAEVTTSQGRVIARPQDQSRGRPEDLTNAGLNEVAERFQLTVTEPRLHDGCQGLSMAETSTQSQIRRFPETDHRKSSVVPVPIPDFIDSADGQLASNVGPVKPLTDERLTISGPGQDKIIGRLPSDENQQELHHPAPDLKVLAQADWIATGKDLYDQKQPGDTSDVSRLAQQPHQRTHQGHNRTTTEKDVDLREVGHVGQGQSKRDGGSGSQVPIVAAHQNEAIVRPSFEDGEVHNSTSLVVDNDDTGAEVEGATSRTEREESNQEAEGSAPTAEGIEGEHEVTNEDTKRATCR